MKRKLHSKFFLYKKIFGKYKNIWLSKKAQGFKSVKIYKEKNKFKKISDFGLCLKKKQNLKIFYLKTKERIFKDKFKSSKKSVLKNIDRFLSLLEKRLDIVLFRSCFVFSLYQSQQLISHGHVFLNEKPVFNFNKKINQLDLIKLNIYKSKTFLKIFKNFVTKIEYKSIVCSHLEISFKNLCICFLWAPSFFELYFPIDIHFALINRFYK